MTGARFPHSEIPGSTLGCQLPGAYRRLPRPSSAPGAKASTVCPKKLEHTRQEQRCSRPLCSSQNTDRTNPQPPPNHRTPQPRNHDAVWRPDQPVSQRTPHQGGALPEKPERMNARSLRTQQRAQPHQLPPTRVPTPRPRRTQAVLTTSSNQPD
jgi:hypothetical protein